MSTKSEEVVWLVQLFLVLSFLKKSINKKILKDSKTISFKDRLKIAEHIKKKLLVRYWLCFCNKEIDKYNIFNASLLSMERAAKKLKRKPHIFLIDGTHAPKKLKNSKTIIKGDEKVKCISAASIVAKAYRDLYMIKLGVNIQSINGTKTLDMEPHNIWCH